MSIVDAPQREDALDPSRSFIVQAPAGSGKTGLLIQRFLRLLAVVERPEEILAITFTRKAAAEMRRRVLQALDRATHATPPDDANERATWELARAALARDRACDWQLGRNAARLRIQTIDALCASLARQMPVLARLGAAPTVVDDPRDLYREAAERTLALVEKEEAESPLARMVLCHLDGDWSVVRRLVAEIMLPKRDQWMRRIEGFVADDEVRAALERGFRAERSRLMQRANDLMPGELVGEICRHARYAADRIEDPSSLLRALADLEGYPPADETGARAWCALAEMLLTAPGEWRKTVTKAQGFPTGGALEKGAKEAMVKFLTERAPSFDAVREALQAVRKAPPPAFSDEQWQVLGALVGVLRRAAAALRDVFAERGEIDFGGIAQAAVEALGEEDAPTDLLLALDVRIQHLLVDEFQDTSLTQWELLKRLTAGWSEGDGRTAFLVGDPMQSIYRFREAEVALFLGAREHGLPSVRLVPLTLQTNFRSQSGIVEWVNATFGAVLPPSEDPDSGAVPYSPSSAHHPALPHEAVQWHPFTGTDPDIGHQAEGERVAQLARDAEPGSVAILVRTRAHLDRIVPELKKAGVRFRAVDIEPLNRRPVIQDLLAITRALSHLADRVAWLAILRAPWCALTMADMHGLLNSPEPSELTVWELLGDAQRMAGLSEQGAERAARTRAVLAPFVEGRARGPLRERVEAAWLALGGPACVERESDLEDAETFFDRLEELDEAGELADPTLLEQDLEWLRAAPDVGEEAHVQVMTIHRAKGLEFDTVIIPGMERVPRVSDKPLFGWKARADGTLMMAPVRRADETEELAYDYLRRLEIEAGDHELDRVFYVAATRARRRLHLLGFARILASGELNAPSRTKSLLGRAWDLVRARFEAATPLEGTAAADLAYRQEVRTLDLAALDVQVAAPPAPPPAPLSPEGPPRFDWASETAIHVGTVTHRWLQRIGEEGIERWSVERVPGVGPTVARELERRGIPAAERAAAADRVMRGLVAALTDERGRWILASHPESRCEYRVRVATPEGVRLVVIDRLVVDAGGKRWIVDYKSGEHQGGELEGFLDNELERYAPQLTRYVAAFPRGSATAALYFPLVRGWRELGTV